VIRMNFLTSHRVSRQRPTLKVAYYFKHISKNALFSRLRRCLVVPAVGAGA
jgi:hypothetical protein